MIDDFLLAVCGETCSSVAAVPCFSFCPFFFALIFAVFSFLSLNPADRPRPPRSDRSDIDRDLDHLQSSSSPAIVTSCAGSA